VEEADPLLRKVDLRLLSQQRLQREHGLLLGGERRTWSGPHVDGAGPRVLEQGLRAAIRV